MPILYRTVWNTSMDSSTYWYQTLVKLSWLNNHEAYIFEFAEGSITQLRWIKTIINALFSQNKCAMLVRNNHKTSSPHFKISANQKKQSILRTHNLNN